MTRGFVFIFILLVALTKFYNVESRSFSLDELYSVVAALQPKWDQFFQNWICYDTNPPLYYLILRVWLKIFPATEFGVRLLSIICIILTSIVLINGIRNRYHNKVWWYYLLLVGTNYSFLFFGQEARAYALLLLFSSFQLFYFIDIITPDKKLPENRLIGLFTLFSILSSYTHYTGILYSAILFFALFILYRDNLKIVKKILIGLMICIVCGLPWLSYTVLLFKMDKSFVVRQDISVLKNMYSMLFFGNSLIGKMSSLVFCGLLFVMSYNLRHRIQQFRIDYKVILILGLLSCLIMVIFPFVTYFFSYRHFIIFIPLLLLSFSILLAAYFENNRSSNAILASLALLITLSQCMTHYRSEREEWRQAVEYVVRTNKNEKASVIIIGEPWEKRHQEYLSVDPGYLNLAIRRKAFYQYYFNRLDTKHDLNLVVLRPEKKRIIDYLTNEMKLKKHVFVLLHGGEFSDELKQLHLGIPVSVKRKDFYMHTVYCFTSTY